MKVVAIIQARMRSTRLPGKVMKTILGKPVIQWDLERVSLSKLIDEIVVAIPYGNENDIIEDTILEYNNKIIIIRGSEDDVLDRYYQAALQTKADVIVRITSDCPLIDPVVIDLVIEQFISKKYDYCSNTLQRTYPRGLDTEVFFFNGLKKAWNEAKEEYEREHVTPYFIENPDKFKLLNVSNNNDLSHLRWTLDTEEDFKFIETIYKKKFHEKPMFFMEDVLLLLNKEPGLIEINKYIKQKKIYS